MLQYCDNLTINLILLWFLLCLTLFSLIPVQSLLQPSTDEVSRNSLREGLASSPRNRDVGTQTREEKPRATPETLLLFLARA